VAGSRIWFRWHPSLDAGAATRLSGDGELAADGLDPLAHGGQPEPLVAGKHLDVAGLEPAAVILDAQHHPGTRPVQPEVHVPGGGVLLDVGQRLLGDPEQDRLHLWVQPLAVQPVGHRAGGQPSPGTGGRGQLPYGRGQATLVQHQRTQRADGAPQRSALGGHIIAQLVKQDAGGRNGGWAKTEAGLVELEADRGLALHVAVVEVGSQPLMLALQHLIRAGEQPPSLLLGLFGLGDVLVGGDHPHHPAGVIAHPFPAGEHRAPRPVGAEDAELDLIGRRVAARAAAPEEPPSAFAAFGLTRREAEVLILVAAGRTNRQIGQELFITPKTASIHVSSILAKLGVAGRGEAAAVAHRLGLDKP
jgi:DNA-binding CsgD family transcriptional regulator